MTSTIPDQCSSSHFHSSLLHRSNHRHHWRLCSSKTIRQHRHWQPNLEGSHRPACGRLCLLRASAAIPNETASAQPGRGLAGCKLAGCGSSAPSAVLTNADLEKLVDTDDDWIRQVRHTHPADLLPMQTACKQASGGTMALADKAEGPAIQHSLAATCRGRASGSGTSWDAMKT